MTERRPARHVLGISGGKDSAALAVYLRDRLPEIEYFFCDTGAELPETYEYLDKLQTALGKPIERLNADRDFDHYLFTFQGALPSASMRWCTKYLKIKPLEAWIGNVETYSYIAIRADENRDGYISHKPNIHPVYPFKEDGIDKAGVQRILDRAGLGLPAYYEWRTRSGCYFCFFQRKAEWVRLSERHPDLFQKAVDYERKAGYEGTAMQGRAYTWTGRESLEELINRGPQIIAGHEAAIQRAQERGRNLPLLDVLQGVLDDEDEAQGCLVCHV